MRHLSFPTPKKPPTPDPNRHQQHLAPVRILREVVCPEEVGALRAIHTAMLHSGYPEDARKVEVILNLRGYEI